MSREDPRPEMATFRALGAARGWRVNGTNCDFQSDFVIETSPTDEVTLSIQDDGPEHGGLGLNLYLYPEEELRDAHPEEMASTIARWLREAADAVEGTPALITATMSEADLQEKIELRQVEMRGIYEQLRDDAALGYQGARSWRIRAQDARQHLGREVALLKAEWARRLIARNGSLPGALAEVGPSREQMHYARIEASQAGAEQRRLERAARNTENERRQRTQDALFALTVRHLVGTEQFKRFWEEARRRFPDQECWNSAPTDFVHIGEAVERVVVEVAERVTGAAA